MLPTKNPVGELMKHICLWLALSMLFMTTSSFALNDNFIVKDRFSRIELSTLENTLKITKFCSTCDLLDKEYISKIEFQDFHTKYKTNKLDKEWDTMLKKAQATPKFLSN